MTTAARGARSGGFSLLEVVIALALVGLVLGALIAAQGQASRAGARAAATGDAVIWAETLLAEVGTAHPYRAGRSEGVLANGAGRYVIVQRQIDRPTDFAAAPMAAPMRDKPTLALIAVEVLIEGRAGASVRLRTLRLTALGPASPAP